MMDMSKYEVPADKLRWRCDPGVFEFECTKDLAPLHEFIGQDRAIRAIEFGLSMNRDGYNIYLAGLTGTGKTSVAKAYIQRLIKEKEAQGEVYRVDDWCYIHNFTHTDRPQILELPRGKGREFRDGVSNLLEKLKKDLVKAFSSEDYKAQRKSIAEESQRRQQKLFDEVKREAHEKGFAIQMSPMGAVLVALAKGKPMTQEDFLALKEPVRKKLEATRAELLKKLQATLEMAQDADRETAEKVQENDRSIASFTISRLFDSLTKKYSGYERIVGYLGDLKAYTVDNVDIFKEEEKGDTVLGMPASHIKRGEDPFLPFQVNLFVDNSRTEGPPVVIESNPNYANLFGKTERRFLLGGYISDHTMLKPGALQLANGGYLLLNATDVLTNPGVWPALKRAIKTKEVCIEEPYEQFGLIAPQALRPLPMPVEVKIIL
ncbi:MAG: AAA family ATPase, partial [Chloroflexi bacterium]|nr:AAA family ATPase [Chloroflexota bacterium]